MDILKMLLEASIYSAVLFAEQRFNRFGQSQGNDSMGTVNALDGTEVNRTGNTSTW